MVHRNCEPRREPFYYGKRRLDQNGFGSWRRRTGLLGERVVKSKLVKKALVKTTAAALRVQKCAAESSASLQAQADDIVAAAKEENQKLEEAEAAEKAREEAAAAVIEDQAK